MNFPSRYTPFICTLVYAVSLFTFLPGLDAAERPGGVDGKAYFYPATKVWILDKNERRIVWNNAGTKLAEGPFLNKKRTGEWSFYFSNGRLKGKGRYIKSRMEGPWKLYHPNGKLKSQGAYHENFRTGHWTLYSNQGWKKSEGAFKDGYKHGAWTEYYPNGKVFYKGNFRKNLESGQWEYFTQSGKLVKKGKFRKGARMGKWYICVMGQCGYKTFKLSNTPRQSGSVKGATSKKQAGRRGSDPYDDLLKKDKRRPGGGWR